MEIGAWIGLSAVIISAATLWNGSRGATISLLQNQVTALQAKVEELERQSERCEASLKDMREQNLLLQRRWLRMRESGRGADNP